MAEGQDLDCGGKGSGATLVGDVLAGKELRPLQVGPWDRLLL